MLLDAVIASRDVSLLAGRFDTALNNMPHGLCMFDAERRLVVSNRRLGELLGISADMRRRRHVARATCSATASRGGTLPSATPSGCRPSSKAAWRARSTAKLFVETEDGRTLALTFQPMADGGSVVLVEDITERKIAEAKINQLARYDALTGLPNRAFFRDQMDAAARQRCGAAARSPSFSSISTSSSRSTTRSAIRAATSCCARSPTGCAALVRSSDIVARFGGDEFVVLQYPLGHPDEAAALAERIVDGAGRALPDRAATRW